MYMSFLTAFTTQLQNLINNLCELFPSDTVLEFTKTSINFMKKNNPRKVQQIFNNYVSKYETQIINKEERFFITKDFIKEDLESDCQDVDYARNIMLNLKKYWKLIDTESKENIWKYLQVLVVLNKKCNSKQSIKLNSFVASMR